MRDLTTLRQEIDRIDSELVRLFEERMNTVLEVAEYKKANNLPILNTGREQQVIEKCVSRLNDPSYASAIQRWIELTMALSRELQHEKIGS